MIDIVKLYHLITTFNHVEDNVPVEIIIKINITSMEKENFFWSP